MVAGAGDERFFASTRGQIVTLLRRGTGTVDGLARALGLTDNGVRAHLSTLERDGLVRQRGVLRAGSGQPAYIYVLTGRAEDLFPKPYDTVMCLLLDVLAEQISHNEREAMLREVGHRLARNMLPTVDAPRTQLEAAAEALNELGGLVELEEQDGTVAIRGRSCPLAHVVAGHPEACLLAAALATDIAGIPFAAHCERGEPPRCRFEQVAQHEVAGGEPARGAIIASRDGDSTERG
ncbi:MAG TPA: ArsR family transcriptional regulator [Ktedonobacterales bacterium]|nr:ArsR family transcriptional regulator [Ktedonobacterales bacterium]